MAQQFTALQTYVNTPDPNYSWVRMEQYDEQGLGYKVQWLNMTSQKWLTENDTDRSIWWHYMAIIIPDNLNPAWLNRGLMYMTGGDNNADIPKITSEDLLVSAILAQTCETVVTVLFQIPNQPVHYYSEKPVPRGRTEDAMIAWGQCAELQHVVSESVLSVSQTCGCSCTRLGSVSSQPGRTSVAGSSPDDKGWCSCDGCGY